MGHIRRSDVNEDWAHAGIVEAGDFVFVSYCVGNVGQSIDEQINGAFDHLIERLKTVGLDLDAVVQMDCLLRLRLYPLSMEYPSYGKGDQGTIQRKVPG